MSRSHGLAPGMSADAQFFLSGDVGNKDVQGVHGTVVCCA
jgi:hypothetical protein